ncbi:gamma-glutamylcyclotransferase-like [Pomacea canaliculata]|uniref:gamma-glutamylcyclotransferase-like n=1 Tax=Pomacea canaliculata TaxID=400727 RepID=UPI000D736218|nr:gamma-glutamylcyclotransferase-like [Pomacea canaliculata]
MMASKKFLYFAYGSNLLRERVMLNNPSATFKCIGKLEGYILTFKGSWSRWRGAAASISKKNDGHVWGVIWEVDLGDIENLDRQETFYDAIEVPVSSISNEVLRCRTYKLSRGYKPGKPSPHYKDVIVRGARQNSLPAVYIAFLESLEDNGYAGEVEVYNSVMQLLQADN